MSIFCRAAVIMKIVGCVYVSGNLLIGKPSTHAFGNDGTAQCMFTHAQPTPYWQVDLQGYYDVENVSVMTCWGMWGLEAKLAAIEVYYTDPTTCPDAPKFLFGTTPWNTNETQTHSFRATSAFPVRYLRVSATVQKKLSISEAIAFGSSYRKQQDFSATVFHGTKGKRVSHPLKVVTAVTFFECTLKCHTTDSCLAFSFKVKKNDNCILSDCPATVDMLDCNTMVVDISVTSRINRL